MSVSGSIGTYIWLMRGVFFGGVAFERCRVRVDAQTILSTVHATPWLLDTLSPACGAHLSRHHSQLPAASGDHCAGGAVQYWHVSFCACRWGNVFPLCRLAVGMWRRPSDFPSYLLSIFIMNLLLYFVQYLTAKLLNKERLSWMVIILLVLAALCWGGSLVFFLNHASDWSVRYQTSTVFLRPALL